MLTLAERLPKHGKNTHKYYSIAVFLLERKVFDRVNSKMIGNFQNGFNESSPDEPGRRCVVF